MHGRDAPGDLELAACVVDLDAGEFVLPCSANSSAKMRYRIGSSLESVPLKSKMTAPGAIGRRSLGYAP
jgi:hypothetical protein